MSGSAGREVGFRWDAAAAGFCFLFALALIANIQPNGDGLWFWYASSVLQGQKLYTDLHLNLQPLFVLLTAGFIKVLGPGWLAFKVFPALQAMVFCLELYLVARFIPLKSWQRGLLLTAVFGLTITNAFYRFDDYHVTTQCLQLGALYLLLLLGQTATAARGLWVAAGLGLLAGLMTASRLNDGAAQFIACALALPFFLAPARRIYALLLFCAATAAGLAGVVLLTGDTIAAWHLESITLASRIKGGTGSILLAPLALPYRLATGAFQARGPLLVVIAVGLILLFARERKAQASRMSRRDVVAWLFAAPMCAYWIRKGAQGRANAELGQVGALLLLAAGAWVLFRIARAALPAGPTAWNRNLLLVLIPAWSLVGAALTSGSSLPDYGPSVAVFLLILPLALPTLCTVAVQRRALLIVCGLIVVAFLPDKVLVPYQWHHYHADPLFEGRVVYRHPVFGPMVIEKAQLDFMLPMCAAIHASGPAPTLLALPYPYPNYFCDIAPWHGYVQTWYDTSGRSVIDKLDGELNTAPPDWIMYQRGLDTMSMHEGVFNGYKPLPHRELDREIMGKIAANQWTIARRVCFEGSDWLLIRSSVPQQGEHRGSADDAADHFATCLPTNNLRFR